MRPLDWERVLAEHRVPFITSGPNVKRGEWRAVPGFAGLYEVSSDGEVRSLTAKRDHGGYRPRVIPGRILKQKRTGRYFRVTLWSGTREPCEVGVHVLVALAFQPNPERLKLVRHLDDDGTNNYAENLAWGTVAQNSEDACRNGSTGKSLTTDDAWAIKFMLANARHTGTRYAPGEIKKIADAYGVSTQLVHHIEAGRIWKHA